MTMVLSDTRSALTCQKPAGFWAWSRTYCGHLAHQFLTSLIRPSMCNTTNI